MAILYLHALSPKLLNRLMKFDSSRLNVLKCVPLQALFYSHYIISEWTHKKKLHDLYMCTVNPQFYILIFHDFMQFLYGTCHMITKRMFPGFHTVFGSRYKNI